MICTLEEARHASEAVEVRGGVRLSTARDSATARYVVRTSFHSQTAGLGNRSDTSAMLGFE